MYKEKDGSLWERGLFKIEIDQKQVWPTELIAFRKTEDGDYAGLCRITSAGQEDMSFAGQMTVNAEINGLSAYKESASGNGEKFKEAEGDWLLQFEAKTDTSDNRVAEPGVQKKGIVIQKVVQTPSNMHVTGSVPEKLAEKNLAFTLSDGDGNRVENEYAGISRQEDGSQILEMECSASQADHFIVQVFDKGTGTEENSEPSLIAEIPFTME